MGEIISLTIILTPIIIWLIYRITSQKAENQRKLIRQQKETEARRISDCGDIVRYFANFHGYVAKSVISREELEEIIDSGKSADELCEIIIDRMDNIQGLDLGYQTIGGYSFPVTLPNEFRDKHIYVVGKSGYGKTNFLRYLIYQDIKAGNGLAVLAPEYEMLNDEILPYIPDERIDDVIYFDPADTEKPVVLNPLHLDQDEDIDLHVDELFTILQRVVGEGGPRMDEILRHSLYALTERPGSDLLDFESLLDRNDYSLRNEIVQTTADDQTRRFFEHTYPQMPKDAHLPIINRIGRIIHSRYVRNCLCPPKHSALDSKETGKRLLNIRRAMDEGKILLFNLSDGLLGEAASQLMGQIIVSKFQTATMSRADTSKGFRKSFYLYLDEFQNFCGNASQSYEKILSRARKYQLGLILAHQQTGQVPKELIRELFGNVTTMVSFQVSQSDASKLGKEFISQFDFEIDKLQPEELLSLSVGEAYVKIGQSAFPMAVPKMDDHPDRERAERVKQNSRDNYGIGVHAEEHNQIHERIEDDDEDPLEGIEPDGVFD